jgi:hypothetical protein
LQVKSILSVFHMWKLKTSLERIFFSICNVALPCQPGTI